MSDYNGWTNYATWRVNLEVFDGFDVQEYFDEKPDVYDLAEWLEAYVDEMVGEVFPDANKSYNAQSITMGWVGAFLGNVNWHEIAKNMLVDWQEEEKEEKEKEEA